MLRSDRERSRLLRPRVHLRAELRVLPQLRLRTGHHRQGSARRRRRDVPVRALRLQGLRVLIESPVMTSSDSDAREQPREIVARLAGSRAQFLEFLERRTGSRVEAEEILQEAYLKSLDKADALREGESAVAWFYRLLRNALIDRFRRRAVATRALERHASERMAQEELDGTELEKTVCGCALALLPTLKVEYAEIVRRVDLEGGAIDDVARSLGITANNAAVRLHRARVALRARLVQCCDSCFDCSCD